MMESAFMTAIAWTCFNGVEKLINCLQALESGGQNLSHGLSYKDVLIFSKPSFFLSD